MAQRIKRLPAMQETRVRSLGWEDPLEKEMSTHSSVLAWEIPWTEFGGLQSMGSQRVRHDCVTKQQHFPCYVVKFLVLKNICSSLPLSVSVFLLNPGNKKAFYLFCNLKGLQISDLVFGQHF